MPMDAEGLELLRKAAIALETAHDVLGWPGQNELAKTIREYLADVAVTGRNGT